MPEAPGLARWLERRWYSSRVPPLLRPFSAIFGLLLRTRRLAYGAGILSSGHPGVPVIVVGNLTVGGTGKTPLVIWLAGRLRGEGLRVGIVSRGHGGRARGPMLVDERSDSHAVGDEALLLARHCDGPVCVGRDRLAAARLLAAAGVQLIVADDGLQHLALRRDFQIVAVDGARGFGNGALLPAGPLREPADRLADADAMVVRAPSRPVAEAVLPAVQPPLRCTMTLEPEGLVRLSDGEQLPPDHLRGRKVHAVAGIGHPAAFFDLLRGLGMRPVEHPFPDHHDFAPGELVFDDGLDVVMTEKDAARIRSGPPRMWYLRVCARIGDSDAARLLQAVHERVAGAHSK